MPMRFQPGDRVLCINANVADYDAKPRRIEKGKVYTIESSHIDYFKDWNVNLVEIRRSKIWDETKKIYGYHQDRFRVKKEKSAFAVVSWKKGFNEQFDIIASSEKETEANELAEKLNRLSQDRIYSVTPIDLASEILLFDLS